MAPVKITIEDSKFAEDEKFIRIRRDARFICLTAKYLEKLLMRKSEIEAAFESPKKDASDSLTITFSSQLKVSVSHFNGDTYLTFNKNGMYLNIGVSEWDTLKKLEHLLPKSVLSLSPIPEERIVKKRIAEDDCVMLDSVKRFKYNELKATPEELSRYLMIHLIRISVNRIKQESCVGCLENYPSQLDHECLNDFHEQYFEEGYMAAEKKYLYILSKVIDNENLSPEYLIQPENVSYGAVRNSFVDEISGEIEEIINSVVVESNIVL